MLLEHLALFLRILEKGGLAAAGREAGLSPASVSEKLAALERHFGVSLLTRTTRAISLTDEGRLLAEGARRLLADADELEAQIRFGAEKISGPIRLTAPEDFGRSTIAPILSAFLDENPDVTGELILTDGIIDIVAEGIDFAVRQGTLSDSSLRIRPIGISRRLACAAPAYLERHGVPQHPDELARHDCIVMRFGQNIDRDWTFLIGGKLKRVRVHGRRIANDGGLVREWCRQGFGIAFKSRWDIAEDLRSGALVALLEPYSAGDTALQIVYPGTVAQPRRVRKLIDRIAGAMANADQGTAPISPSRR